MGQRSGRCALIRPRRSGPGNRTLLLRVETLPGEEPDDLVTDLRLLGLRPTILRDPADDTGATAESAASAP
jgi:hypothetical protein